MIILLLFLESTALNLNEGSPRACEWNTITIIYQNTRIDTNISIWLGDDCDLHAGQQDCINTCMHLYLTNSIVYIPQNISNGSCVPVTSEIDISWDSTLVPLKWRILMDPNITVCDLLIHDLRMGLKNITMCEQNVAELHYKFFVVIFMITSVGIFIFGFVIMFVVFAYWDKCNHDRESEYLLGVD
jgi:hypothetical protein